MALIICSECGKQYSDNAMACPNCGNPTKRAFAQEQLKTQTQYSYVTQNQTMAYPYAEKLSTKEQTSGIIWMVIAIIQVIIGICGLWFTLIVAVVNGLGAYSSLQKAKKVKKPYVGMVDEYEKQLTPFIISLAYNAIFGGVIGVVGNIYDLITRNYVLTNRAAFESIAEENAQREEAEAQATGKLCLTINYTSATTGAKIAAYTIDGMPEKYTVSTAAPAKHYLYPGVHTVNFKYNFKAYSFAIEMNEDKSIDVYCTATEILQK